MCKTQWSASVLVDGKTTFTVSGAAQATEAIDTVEVIVKPNDQDKVLDVQPGDVTAVRLLVVKSSVYDAQLTYKFSDGNQDSSALQLDAPHVFTAGSLAPFNLAPKQLKVTNKTTTPATVTVFVGRDATPEQS